MLRKMLTTDFCQREARNKMKRSILAITDATVELRVTKEFSMARMVVLQDRDNC